MDEMREIVTVEQVERWFLILAIAAPLIGLAVGAVVGRRRGEPRTGAVQGLLVGLIGPVNLLLWKVYNAITNRLGLDSVKNLLVQLALFAALGVAAGLGLGRFTRKEGAVLAEAPAAEDAADA